MLFSELLKSIVQRFELSEEFTQAFLNFSTEDQTNIAKIILAFVENCETTGISSKRDILTKKVVFRDEKSSVYVGFGFCTTHRKVVIERCDVGTAELAVYQYQTKPEVQGCNVPR